MRSMALFLAAVMLWSTWPAAPVDAATARPLTVVAPAPSPAPAYAAPVSVALLMPPQDAATATPTLTQDQQCEALMQLLDAAWNAQNWPLVLNYVNQIKAINPTYDDIVSKEYFAHVNYGYQLMTSNQCSEALAQFNAALPLDSTPEEAQQGIALMSVYCLTPVPGTPTATATPIGALTATFTPVVIGTITFTPTPTVSGTATVTTTCVSTITVPITYVVQAGDTLSSLARRYCTTIQAIMQANGMMSYFLRAGDLIWIPSGGVPAAGPVVHIVQPGETLNSLARQYNTTVWAIMSANGLTSYSLHAYQALFIPTLQQPGPLIHIVWPGETLYTIALKYGKTVTELMLANGLHTYEIHVYQRIIIPPAGYTGWPMGWPDSPGNPLPPFGSSTYTVLPGDTLYSIANKFGVSVRDLKAANGLRGSTIYVGMKLKIPQE